jgi:hypothetical protein
VTDLIVVGRGKGLSGFEWAGKVAKAHSDLEKINNSDQTRHIKWFLLVYVLSSGLKVTLFQTDFFERIFSDSV